MGNVAVVTTGAATPPGVVTVTVRKPLAVGSVHVVTGGVPVVVVVESSLMNTECVAAPAAGVTLVLASVKLLVPVIVPSDVVTAMVVPTGMGLPTSSTTLRSTRVVVPEEGAQPLRSMTPAGEIWLTVAVEPENTMTREPRTSIDLVALQVPAELPAEAG